MRTFDSRKSIEFQDSSVSDAWLDQFLNTAYNLFKVCACVCVCLIILQLVHGPLSRLGLTVLSRTWAEFFDSFLTFVDFERAADFFDSFGGISYLPMKQITYLTCVSAFNILQSKLPQLKYALMLNQTGQFVWTNLDRDSAKYAYLFFTKHSGRRYLRSSSSDADWGFLTLPGGGRIISNAADAAQSDGTNAETTTSDYPPVLGSCLDMPVLHLSSRRGSRETTEVYHALIFKVPTRIISLIRLVSRFVLYRTSSAVLVRLQVGF